MLSLYHLVVCHVRFAYRYGRNTSRGQRRPMRPGTNARDNGPGRQLCVQCVSAIPLTTVTRDVLTGGPCTRVLNYSESLKLTTGHTYLITFTLLHFLWRNVLIFDFYWFRRQQYCEYQKHPIFLSIIPL